MAKSPLRYPGGKTRAVKILKDFIPKQVTEVCSPFFGGGSFELYMESQGIAVHGYDKFEPLVFFWKKLLTQPNLLVEEVESLYPVSKEQFASYQKHLMSKSELTAALFFVINRCSFSGATLSGGMSTGHPRFTKSSIDRLKEFKTSKLTVDALDFTDSICKHPLHFVYADPPYLLKANKLYGVKGDMHNNFDHYALFEILNSRNNWVLSYNNTPTIINLYKDYTILYPEWSYGMSKDKQSKELLILSHDHPASK